MVNESYLEILKQGVEVWNKWREDHPEMRPDLRDANLSNANLSNATLSKAHLENANLSNALAGDRHRDGLKRDHIWCLAAQLVQASRRQTQRRKIVNA